MEKKLEEREAEFKARLQQLKDQRKALKVSKGLLNPIVLNWSRTYASPNSSRRFLSSGGITITPSGLATITPVPAGNTFSTVPQCDLSSKI
jgi:hypothetical protein